MQIMWYIRIHFCTAVAVQCRSRVDKVPGDFTSICDCISAANALDECARSPKGNVIQIACDVKCDWIQLFPALFGALVGIRYLCNALELVTRYTVKCTYFFLVSSRSIQSTCTLRNVIDKTLYRSSLFSLITALRCPFYLNATVNPSLNPFST